MDVERRLDKYKCNIGTFCMKFESFWLEPSTYYVYLFIFYNFLVVKISDENQFDWIDLTA